MFWWLSRARRGRTLGILLVAAAFLLGVAAAPASAQGDKRVVKVMTYNMDAGTDFVYFFAYFPDLARAYAATLEELRNSGFEQRAAALAKKIEAEKPDLISLVEVAVWDYVDNGGQRISLIADQLELLKAALTKKKLSYEVVEVQPLTDLAMAVGANANFHYLDRNVVLARADLPASQLSVTNVMTGHYHPDIEVLPDFFQVNGWISVDATVWGQTVRFFATHLISPVPEHPEVQSAQGAELVQVMSESPYPVVLAGDFNSDMSGLGVGPDQTSTAPDIVAAGYTDAWAAVHQPWEGLTWPLYWEDLYAGFYPDGAPVERIDLILTKDLEVQKAKVVGTEMPYPSDHAGVVAWIALKK